MKFNIKSILFAILIIFISIPNTTFATTPPPGWASSFIVNGVTLNFRSDNCGSYFSEAGDGQYSNLSLTQANHTCADYHETPYDPNNPNTYTALDSRLWFVAGASAGSVISAQFFEGDPAVGFSDCLSKRYSYFPWGAGATPLATGFDLEDLIGNLSGAGVSGRYYFNTYLVAESSCAVASDTDAPEISDVIVDVSTSTASITFITNESATSTIGYSLDLDFDTIIDTNSATTSHEFNLASLTPDTLYNYQITVTDEYSNSTTTESTFTTDEEPVVEEDPILGCMDEDATNYDPDVTEDDDSCTYPERSRSRGSSVNSRAKNLIAMGKTEEARELQQQFPNAFINPISDTSPTNFSRDLTVGASGEDVRLLQRKLNEKGYVVSADGPGSLGQETDFFGRLTLSALIRFQIDKGINPAIGYFGPITRGIFNQI